MLTDDEIKLLADRGVKVAHCPESNMKLASGTAPVVKMLEAGITVGLGTDGSASNNDVDMFGEMNSAAKIHKVAGWTRRPWTPPQPSGWQPSGGAAVLGADG